MVSSKLLYVLATAAFSSAFDPQLGWNSYVEVENRTLDEIYQAALKEGGTVTLWHGGDEKNQQDSLKSAFEERFPGMTLNVTVDLSKYHDVNIDRQIATGDVYVDSVALQTLHDYPRWKSQGVLLPYKPLGWESLYKDFRDADGYYNSFYVLNWVNRWNTNYVREPIREWDDFLRPEFKNKLVLTYPNDDDAVLFAFDLVMKVQGYEWFEKLLAQNPRWVRGSATPNTLIRSSNGTYTASFTGSLGLTASPPFNVSFPTTSGDFVSWPQTGAILKDAPHPEGAKLLHSFILSKDFQESRGGWSVRSDVDPPAGYPGIFEMPGTDVTKFSEFMEDRAAIERLRFFFEDRIGSPQGLSPLEDNI
ncbi:ABC transporter [Phyllosticta citriasiana]|uniref:ABC transporter n=1 Tax=Phyllosticta citriasiana TaxID=595635 RepID=A0ABR1L123_9PEZI